MKSNNTITVRKNGVAREVDLRVLTSVLRTPTGGTVLRFLGGADDLLIDDDYDVIHRVWRVTQERRAAQMQQEMPPSNIDESNALPAVGLHVCSWSPGRLEEKIPSTEVHISVPVEVEDLKFRAVVRYRTRASVLAVIDALQKHVEDVWPSGR